MNENEKDVVSFIFGFEIKIFYGEGSGKGKFYDLKFVVFEEYFILSSVS